MTLLERGQSKWVDPGNGIDAIGIFVEAAGHTRGIWRGVTARIWVVVSKAIVMEVRFAIVVLARKPKRIQAGITARCFYCTPRRKRDTPRQFTIP